MTMSKTNFRHFFTLGLLAAALFAASGRAQVFRDERELVVPRRFERIVHIRMGRSREVDAALANELIREIDRAAANMPAAVVIEIDSPGGSADAARTIVEHIRSFREMEDLRIFGYVPRSALSAAAWIALGCRGLLIAPDAVIGDIQPLTLDYRGFDRAPEKIVTALTEEIVQTTRNNGIERPYPRLFIEAMVDRDVEIIAVDNPRLGTTEYMRAEDYARRSERDREGLRTRPLSLPNGKVLTTSGRDMLDYGFTVKIVRDAGKIVDVLGTPNAKVEKRELKRRKPLGIDFDWELLLIVAGIVLLILELKTPGIGVFGILGLASFILFFLIRAGWSDAALWPIVVLLVGAFLVLVEVIFLPGMIVPGLVGLALVLYSTYMGVAHPGETGFWIPDLSDEEEAHGVVVWAGMLTGSLVVGITASMTIGRFLHHVPILGRLVLRPPAGLRLGPSESVEAKAATTAEAVSADGTQQSVQVGATGRADTDLRPSGYAVLDGHRVDVVARNGFITRGSPVEVCEVSGNRVVVKPSARTASP